MIRLIDVEKVYKKSAVRSGITGANLTIEHGESILISGPSGSGKSTILSLIAGVLRPDSGIVEIDGQKLSKLPQSFAALFRREHIGYIFQRFHLLPSISVYHNIALPLLPQNLPKEQIDRRVMEQLERFGLNEKKEALCKELSGGQQQRVAIARALVNSPKIILADEPTVNLDKELTDEFLRIYTSLWSEGITTIMATHDEQIKSMDIFTRKLEISEIAKSL